MTKNNVFSNKEMTIESLIDWMGGAHLLVYKPPPMHENIYIGTTMFFALSAFHAKCVRYVCVWLKKTKTNGTINTSRVCCVRPVLHRRSPQ